MLDPLREIADRPEPRAPGAGEAKVQLVRTLSRKSNALFAVGPLKSIREVKAAQRRCIRGARKQLYIEAQFFRSEAAARWVEERSGPAATWR
jgi:hypothetical protein